MYTCIYIYHQNDACVKMGSDESHFSVSLSMRDKVKKTMSTDHHLWRQKRAEAESNRGPSAYQPNAWPLGQIGSLKAVRLKSLRLKHVFRVQELCESRGGRPGLPVLMSLMVSVDVKQHWTMLTHWSQFVPNTSTRHPRTALHHHHQQHVFVWNSHHAHFMRRLTHIYLPCACL